MSFEQTVRANLLAVVDAYVAATGMPMGMVSRRFYGNNHFLEKYRNGSITITVKRVDEMLKQFREEWPKQADWPMSRAVYMDRDNGENTF